MVYLWNYSEVKGFIDVCRNVDEFWKHHTCLQKTIHYMYLCIWMSRKGICNYRKKTGNCLQGSEGVKSILGWCKCSQLNHGHSWKLHILYNSAGCMLSRVNSVPCRLYQNKDFKSVVNQEKIYKLAAVSITQLVPCCLLYYHSSICTVSAAWHWMSVVACGSSLPLILCHSLQI